MKITDKPTVVFVGGGTGGHIYPGLAVAASLKERIDIKTVWIGSSRGMDKRLVEKSGTVDAFIGIPSGKLRRYFSLRNFFDVFKIFAGLVASFFVLLRIKPIAVFSKGGFVSVPPCAAAKLLKIPVFTHECDFSPGLATRLNARFATKVLVSYEKTASFFAQSKKDSVCVTGNPVRPVFYTANAQKGREFLGLSEDETKPVLLVLGGSLGAKQINDVVSETLNELCEHFVVVHQTGNKGKDASKETAAAHETDAAKNARAENADVSTGGVDAPTVESLIAQKKYLPFAFIYDEMPHVLSCADVVLSRAGANALWEAATLGKAMVLLPLSGSGTRGDQVENAEYFAAHHAACMIDPKSDILARDVLNGVKSLLDKTTRETIGKNAKRLVGEGPATTAIVNVLINETPLSALPQKKPCAADNMRKSALGNGDAPRIASTANDAPRAHDTSCLNDAFCDASTAPHDASTANDASYDASTANDASYDASLKDAQ